MPTGPWGTFAPLRHSPDEVWLRVADPALTRVSATIHWTVRHGLGTAGVRAMIWYIIVLTPLCVGSVALLTPETVAPEPPGQKFRLRDYVDLITHPSMSRILLADFCLAMGPGWMTGLFLFFSRDRMQFTTTEANMLLMLNVIVGLFGWQAFSGVEILTRIISKM